MNRVVVIGAGGHGREIADVVVACGHAGAGLEFQGFLDDDPALHGRTFCGAPVLGPLEWLKGRTDDVQAVLGIGMPRVKRAVVARAAELGVKFRTLIHPSASLTPWVTIGEGAFIAAGCVLTNEIEIGAHAHINRCVTVGHDCRIGSFCHVAPGAVISGNVQLEEGTDIGANATVLQNLTVGAWAIVGAGAVVTRSLAAGVTAVGVPARPLAKPEASRES